MSATHAAAVFFLFFKFALRRLSQKSLLSGDAFIQKFPVVFTFVSRCYISVSCKSKKMNVRKTFEYQEKKKILNIQKICMQSNKYDTCNYLALF